MSSMTITENSMKRYLATKNERDEFNKKMSALKTRPKNKTDIRERKYDLARRVIRSMLKSSVFYSSTDDWSLKKGNLAASYISGALCDHDRNAFIEKEVQAAITAAKAGSAVADQALRLAYVAFRANPEIIESSSLSRYILETLVDPVATSHGRNLDEQIVLKKTICQILEVVHDNLNEFYSPKAVQKMLNIVPKTGTTLKPSQNQSPKKSETYSLCKAMADVLNEKEFVQVEKLRRDTKNSNPRPWTYDRVKDVWEQRQKLGYKPSEIKKW